MKIISTSAVALSLLIAAVPFAAFADESGASVSVSEDVQMNANPSMDSLHLKGSQVKGPLDNLKVLVSPMLRTHLEVNHENESSTSDPRIPLTDVVLTKIPHDGKNSPEMKHNEGNGVQAHGDAEITARITSLNKMIARIGDAQRLSTDAKASLSAQLSAQITALTNLKAQIDSGATTTLKTDVQSITKDFRIYALVMPKAAITAAADRIMSIVAQMETLSAKITTRIAAAQTAGADITAATAAHADFDVKIADAKVQAQAAVTEVANLSVDAGATTTLAANTAALKDAKSKIDAAQADLKAARKDVETILKALKGRGEVKGEAHASTTHQ